MRIGSIPPICLDRTLCSFDAPVCGSVKSYQPISDRGQKDRGPLSGALCSKHEKQILDYTRAVAFLGTPHRGSDLASWGTIVGNMVNLVKRTNTDIIGVLQSDSGVLENVIQAGQAFHTMLRSHERACEASVQITCFVEELPVTKAGKSFMVRRYITS